MSTQRWLNSMDEEPERKREREREREGGGRETKSKCIKRSWFC